MNGQRPSDAEIHARDADEDRVRHLRLYQWATVTVEKISQ